MSSDKKRVAIVGAGFTGLAAAWVLHKQGFTVSVFEKERRPGGLASGFSKVGWDWSLEHHYHHIFASDKTLLNWLAELGLKNEIKFYEAISSSQVDGRISRLDSPLSLLSLPHLKLIDKLRVGIVLAFFKLLPSGQWLERWPVESSLPLLMGRRGYELLWRPMMKGKFGKYATKVNLAWFWARIKARTKSLAYPNRGFLYLSEQIVEKLRAKQVEFLFGKGVGKIKQTQQGWLVDGELFDQVLVTGSAKLLSKLCLTLPANYVKKITSLKMLGAMTLILEMKKPFFKDNIYWLNITRSDWPMLAVVEHTNLVTKNNFSKSSLLYVGNYLPANDKRFSLGKHELLKLYKPYLEKLNPDFSENVVDSWLFKHPEAQPIVEINHSQKLPAYSTPLKGLFWSGMQHIYPWDRGVNFAVKAGFNVASIISQTKK